MIQGPLRRARALLGRKFVQDVIALQTGKKLDWDPAKRVFAQEEGNALISRPMRAPWKLEV